MQAAEVEISFETAQNLGLNESEYKKVVEILGRVPNFTELSIYAIMWSNPCSYKDSIKWIKTLPTEGKSITDTDRTENFRLVDLGNGLACSMKVSSSILGKNATAGFSTRKYFNFNKGIYANGAMPFAALNLINFAKSDISDFSQFEQNLKEYSKSLELSAVSAKLNFTDSIHQNSYSNTISLGLIPTETSNSSFDIEPGSPVYIIQVAEEKKDQFQEKHLIEAILEAVRSEYTLAIQEIDATGIAGASAIISSQSHTGMTIELSKILGLLEETNSSEVLISNSNGEFLIVGKKEEEIRLLDIFSHWEIDCKEVGQVTETGFLEYLRYGHLIAEIPANSLVPGGGAPINNRRVDKPKYFAQIKKFRNGSVKSSSNIVETAKRLFSSPNLISKKWVLEQNKKDNSLNENIELSPSDATILRLEDTNKAVAVAMRMDTHYTFADPYVGGMIAVAEAARDITCSGGTPVALANCLNFGNPHQPEEYYQFINAIKGIGEACRKFDTPQIDFEVNFKDNELNDKQSTSFRPALSIGVLGIIKDIEDCTTLDFKEEGDLIYMVGNLSNDLGSSEYLRSIHNIEFSSAPEFDLYEEFEIQKHVRKMIQKGLLKSAHGVSRGGLFASLLESSIHRGFGFNIETVDTFRLDSFLFGESQSRIVISLALEQEDNLQNYLINNNVSFTKLGEVFGDEIIIDDKKFGSINDWKRIYDNTFGDESAD